MIGATLLLLPRPPREGLSRRGQSARKRSLRYLRMWPLRGWRRIVNHRECEDEIRVRFEFRRIEPVQVAEDLEDSGRIIQWRKQREEIARKSRIAQEPALKLWGEDAAQ